MHAQSTRTAIPMSSATSNPSKLLSNAGCCTQKQAAQRSETSNDGSSSMACGSYVLVPFEQCWEVLQAVWRVLGIVCFGETVARVAFSCGIGVLRPITMNRSGFAGGSNS